MSSPGRLVPVGALSLVLSVACGGESREERPHAATPAGQSDDLREPPTVPSPAGEPAHVTPPEPTPAATGPAQLVLLHGHELLRSEERQIEQLESALRRASVTLERAPAGDRTAALEAWLSESDPAVRAQMALGVARGDARAVLVLRIAPPVQNRAQGVSGFGVIAGEPPHERLWAQGNLPATARASLAVFLSEGGAP